MLKVGTKVYAYCINPLNYVPTYLNCLHTSFQLKFLTYIVFRTCEIHSEFLFVSLIHAFVSMCATEYSPMTKKMHWACLIQYTDIDPYLQCTPYLLTFRLHTNYKWKAIAHALCMNYSFRTRRNLNLVISNEPDQQSGLLYAKHVYIASSAKHSEAFCTDLSSPHCEFQKRENWFEKSWKNSLDINYNKKNNSSLNTNRINFL